MIPTETSGYKRAARNPRPESDQIGTLCKPQLNSCSVFRWPVLEFARCSVFYSLEPLFVRCYSFGTSVTRAFCPRLELNAPGGRHILFRSNEQSGKSAETIRLVRQFEALLMKSTPGKALIRSAQLTSNCRPATEYAIGRPTCASDESVEAA